MIVPVTAFEIAQFPDARVPRRGGSPWWRSATSTDSTAVI